VLLRRLDTEANGMSDHINRHLQIAYYLKAPN
jgi:hypothetical protein